MHPRGEYLLVRAASATKFRQTQRSQPKREFVSLPKVSIFFKSFKVLDNNVPTFWKETSFRFGCDRCTHPEHVPALVRGQVRWCSPEGMSVYKYDIASDVYSFGMTVIEVSLLLETVPPCCRPHLSCATLIHVVNKGVFYHERRVCRRPISLVLP